MNPFEARATLPRDLIHASGLLPRVTRIEVARGDELQPGNSTRGIVRDTAFDLSGAAFARSRIGASVSSGWHHHGDRNLFGYLVSGLLRFDYGSKGALAVEIRPGDFFHIPPRLIHRDVNPRTDAEAVVVNLLMGEGDAVVNVSGPSD